MFNPLKNEKDTIQIYDVPYSEHSSFTELRECVALWKPTWIIPTVNVTANDTIQKLLRS
jgi:DNA cross-link repair 1A protein